MSPQVNPDTVSRPKADALNNTYNDVLSSELLSETRDGILDRVVTKAMHL